MPQKKKKKLSPRLLKSSRFFLSCLGLSFFSVCVCVCVFRVSSFFFPPFFCLFFYIHFYFRFLFLYESARRWGNSRSAIAVPARNVKVHDFDDPFRLAFSIDIIRFYLKTYSTWILCVVVLFPVFTIRSKQCEMTTLPGVHFLLIISSLRLFQFLSVSRPSSRQSVTRFAPS